jgi:uncharacterized membrane protein YadS
MNSKILFAIGLFFCLTPWASPPLALLAGLAFGAIATHPYKDESRKLSKVLLQSAVVGLGFGMNLQEVLHAGASGFMYTALGIGFALIVGTLLGKLIAVQPRAAFLISTGTAICGGSAIAAIGPITGATEDEMSVSLGTIFVLNSIALLTFPAIGLWLKLSQTQFGLWAALAIHDTSSVPWPSGPPSSSHERCGLYLCRLQPPPSRAARRESSGRGSFCSSAWRPWPTRTCFRARLHIIF